MSTILIIDPERHEREQCRRTLRRCGYTVATASVKGALAALDAEAPDLVVFEPGAPAHGGIAVMQDLHTASPRMPIILNTAFGSYLDDFRVWLADAYVAKSDDDALRARIREVLG